MSMEHEHINDRSVAICVRGAKMTGRLLAQAMQAFLKKLKEPSYQHGEQSLKSLTKRWFAVGRCADENRQKIHSVRTQNTLFVGWSGIPKGRQAPFGTRFCFSNVKSKHFFLRFGREIFPDLGREFFHDFGRHFFHQFGRQNFLEYGRENFLIGTRLGAQGKLENKAECNSFL